MRVRFWGTRGSIPTPGPATARYGGNTSCVELRTDDGHLFVLDCGTGIRELGRSLLSGPNPPSSVHLLIGHTHWDHIQGFPFFTPVFLPRTEIHIYAPLGFQQSLEDVLSGQMQYSYFPVKLEDLASRIHYTELDEGFFRIGDCLVETRYLNHTAPTVAYRITEGPTSIAYVTDHEPFWKSSSPVFEHPGDQRHVEFIRDADLLIHDAQYNEEEYEVNVGWGHSPIGYAANVALAANVRRLALFHHDPTHNDDWIEAAEREVRGMVAARNSNVQVFAAAEGMDLEIQGERQRVGMGGDSALDHHSILGQRILLVTPDENDFAVIERLLIEDGLIIMPAGTAAEALERVEDFGPDLAIVDEIAVSDNATFLEDLRLITENPRLPIILLTESHDIARARLDGATDYVAGSFSQPMLRSRVRAWLSRTAPERSSPPAPASPSIRTSSGGDPEPAGSAEALAQTGLFSNLEIAVLETLVSNASDQIFPPGYPILREGEMGTSVFIVLSGRVRIMESVHDGPAEMFLAEMGRGEIFGEIGLLRNMPRSATVLTLERTRCLVLPQEQFLHALDASPALSLALLRVLAGRLAAADRLLARYAPDPLTGLPRRRAFHDLYSRLAAGARRRGSGVVLLLIDIKNLKAINDEFGYPVGDEVLKATSEALLGSSRATDLVARHGGDEFAMLLMDAGVADSKQITRRLNEHLQTLARDRVLPVSVHYHVGIASSADVPDRVDLLLRRADEDIQEKKKAARQP